MRIATRFIFSIAIAICTNPLGQMVLYVRNSMAATWAWARFPRTGVHPQQPIGFHEAVQLGPHVRQAGSAETFPSDSSGDRGRQPDGRTVLVRAAELG